MSIVSPMTSCFFLLIGTANVVLPCNVIDNKPTLVGTVFESILTDVHGLSQRDRLVFADATLTCTCLQSIGVSKIPYTQKVGETVQDIIQCTAETEDTCGNRIAFVGEVAENEMTGTLTVTTRKGAISIYSIIAAKPGSNEAKTLLSRNVSKR